MRTPRELTALLILSSTLVAACAEVGLVDVPTEMGDLASVASSPDLAAGPPASSCRVTATSSVGFGAAVTVSDATLGSLVPVVAAHGTRVLIAWHEASQGASRVVYAIAQAGCVGELRTIGDAAPSTMLPALAATTAGFVLAYQATDGPTSRVRAVWLDDDGAITAGPEAVSDPSGYAAYPDVSAAGDDVAFAWLDETGHGFALRGPGETVAASHAPAVLSVRLAGSAPRVAIDAAGTTHLGWRDGSSTTQEVFLASRPRGLTFGVAQNLSASPGALSDDVTLVSEPDGTLDFVFVDQTVSGDSFELYYRTRAPSGALSPRAPLATLGLWSWRASALPGLAAAWRTGQGATGPIYFTDGRSSADAVLAGEVASAVSLAQTIDGALHLVLQDASVPRRIRYAIRTP